jgi:predicted amidohydrolase YtcJ
MCADTVFYNGHILTGAHLRPEDHSATPAYVTAIAVRAGRIVGVGTDEQMLAEGLATTKKVDLQGAFAMPGFNDAHTHMAAAGQQKLAVDLDNVPSLAAMQAKIREYAATLAPGQWILGGGWDHTKWASKKLPTRQDLDAVTGDHPAYLERTDGHIAVVNTAALRAAHITAATQAPAGSQIDVEAGSLTGIVREGPALALVQQVIPKPSPEMRRKALMVAINDALSHGVTSVQDFSDYDDFLALEAMEQEGSLHLRFSEWLAFELPIGVLDSRRAEHSSDDNLLHLGMLKAFMDGSLGSRTAAMFEPYSDDPNNSGIPRYDQGKLNEMSAQRAADGFQLGFHAIGDLANDMALNAFAAAEQVARPANALPPPANPDADVVTSAPKTPSPRDLRFRIEHAQVVSPGAFQRFHDLGVIASMQPSHLLTDMAWAGQRLGPERSKYAYAWKSFLDHGVTLAFGTDYPVESIDPFRGLYSAVTRKNEAGTQTFQPQERLTLQQALYAYTQASAFAEFREKVKGRLEPGYLADMVVLDRDITKAAPQDLLHTRVLRTVVDGQTVYSAK